MNRDGGRIAFLDGLRGWASLMVVLSHLLGQFARHVVPGYGSWTVRLVSDGHLAVVTFFILSGAALSLRFVHASRPVPLVRLIAGRYVRLVVPILGVTLIVYMLLLFHVAGDPRAARLSQSEIMFGAFRGEPAALSQALQFATFDVLFRYEHRPSFDWSLWTMPIEFKGSLLIFALIAALAWSPWKGRAFRTTVAALACAALLGLGMPLAACFFLGYLMAEAGEFVRAAPAWLGRAPLMLPILTALLAIALDVMGGPYDMIDALRALTIVQMAAWWPWLRDFLSNATSRWLGRMSFPLYLIHVPVIALSGHAFVALAGLGIALTTATHLTVAIALVASLLAARALMPLENCSIAWSRRILSDAHGQSSRSLAA